MSGISISQRSALTIALLFSVLSAWSQEVLTREEAARLALNYNYDIRVAQKNVEVAENNASIFNSGFLPSANASGNANVTYNKGENETAQQGTFEFDATDAYNYGASATINYTIFDGLGRLYDYKQLKEQHGLTELQAKQIIENTLVELSAAYFEIAQLSENVRILQDAMNVSRKRLQRATYAYEYGQATQLDVLNAEVDVNNDSISLMNTGQQLDNAKRNLNLIMGQPLTKAFDVDTAVAFELLPSEEELSAKALERNVRIEQTRSQLRNNEFAIKASRSGWFPSVLANAGYAYNGNRNPASPFLIGSQSYGPQAGISLSWNIFDGGRTHTQVQNAKIALETSRIEEERTANTVQRDVLNAHATYTNALMVLDAQRVNLKTAQRNFDRSGEMYRQGQITSIEFRQAQLNLLNAQSSYNQAKYSAKNAELQLKQLAGLLLED